MPREYPDLAVLCSAPSEQEHAEEIGHYHEGDEADQADENALLEAEDTWQSLSQCQHRP
jgi:hypothetical protein